MQAGVFGTKQVGGKRKKRVVVYACGKGICVIILTNIMQDSKHNSFNFYCMSKIKINICLTPACKPVSSHIT